MVNVPIIYSYVSARDREQLDIAVNNGVKIIAELFAPDNIVDRVTVEELKGMPTIEFHFDVGEKREQYIAELRASLASKNIPTVELFSTPSGWTVNVEAKYLNPDIDPRFLQNEADKYQVERQAMFGYFNFSSISK
ncbi:MAG: hypothetical protein LBJ25_06625 [Candidatus Margulisbacteria bacterium]|nr:hypothetical protein [Candidatus Margulisiibacteriota bacterium]